MEDVHYYEAAGDPVDAENLPVTSGASPAEDKVDEVVDPTTLPLTQDDEEGGK